MKDFKHKEDILKVITAFHPQAKVYLFGSYAQGTQKQGSDIDVAIDTGRRLDLHEWQFLKNLIDALPTAQQIDLIDLHRVPEAMRQAILKEGIVWKS